MRLRYYRSGNLILKQEGKNKWYVWYSPCWCEILTEHFFKYSPKPITEQEAFIELI